MDDFNNQDYKRALENLTEVLGKDSGYVTAYLLQAEIYHELDSVELEINSFEKARQISPNASIFYRLGEACYSSGKYKKALTYYNSYLTAGNVSEERNSEIQQKIDNCNFAIEAQLHPIDFHPEKMNSAINSNADEYWPVISLDQKKLVFTRLVKSGGLGGQEDFYISEKDSSGWERAVPVSDINTSLNEGAEILSADGKLMFFTACNRRDGKGSCDIYYSRLIAGKWTNPKNAGAPVNSAAWEAQPGFSSDNRFLYFSSTRPGGKGGKDIWRAEYNGFDNFGNINWGAVENLGDSINSRGDEISPFIHPNNKNFYFVSNSRTGMGGFDLFTSNIRPDGTFALAKNMGYPINTNKDELGLNISADGRTAYFSSARDKNSGLDIYSFELGADMRPDPVTYLNAVVLDAKTNKAVRAQVDLINLSRKDAKERSEFTDAAGEILLCLPLGANYAFNVSEKGYLFYSRSFQLTDVNSIHDPYRFTIELQPLQAGAEMNLYNIYFEPDSFNLLPGSEPELQKLITFLKENSGVNVEIQGHTDDTGSPEHNLQLSELRAKSVVNYLIKNGIEKNRLTSKGYGQNFPVASNNTEEGRSLNRRTTIKIL